MHSRIVDHIQMRLGDLLLPSGPLYRPSEEHLEAREGLLAQLGQYQAVVAYRSAARGGLTLLLDEQIPLVMVDPDAEGVVTVVDLDDSEASTARAGEAAILDDLLKSLDSTALDALLREASTDSPAVAALLDALAQEHGIVPGVEAGAGEDMPVEIDEAQPTRAQVGDVWRVGRHTVVCGDSTDAALVQGVVAGRKVGMVWADPPYGMNLDASYKNSIDNTERGIKRSRGYEPVAGDDRPFDLRPYLDLFSEVKEQFWWGADYYRDQLPGGGSWVAWDKRAGLPDFDYSSSEFELCWTATPHLRELLRIRWFGAFGMEQEGGKRVHPTQKPIALAAWAFEKYGAASDLILDPFLGSGPSLKAAEQMGDERTVIGFELSPHYVDHVLTWAEAEGLTVERVND